jgi:Tfp pilus assembly protein PilF
VLNDLGDLISARACSEEALRIAEAAYGPNHPKVSTQLNNLGYVLHDMGDLAGARACYNRALNICKKIGGNEHPDTRTVQNNLNALAITENKRKKSR